MYKETAGRFDIRAIPGLDQVHEAELLGVQFTCTLSFTEHVSTALKLCSQRLYLLKLLNAEKLFALRVSFFSSQ